MSEVFMNGRYMNENEARISVFDRAVQLGDGLFETIRGHNGQPAFLGLHYERLKQSARRLKMDLSCNMEEIKNILIELCRRNNVAEAKIRLTLTRGIHPGGLELAGGDSIFIATAEKYQPHSPGKYEDGYALAVSKIVHFSGGALTGLKTLNYLEFLLARDEAFREGADEVLLLNETGQVTECSSANIFCVISNTIVTPDMKSGILPGVIRDVVINLARTNHIKVKERGLALDELFQADEVFITSSLRGIMPVSRIGDIKYPGERPLARKLSSFYLAKLDEACP